MSFDINEKIKTELHYKDVSIITHGLLKYIEERKKVEHFANYDPESAKRAKSLIKRLNDELYDCPQTEPNGH